MDGGRILPDGVQHRRNCLLQDIDNAVEERIAGHERRRQANAVQRDARVEPALEQRVRELLRETGLRGEQCLGRLVGHHFYRGHQPKAAHVTHAVHRFQSPQPLEQPSAAHRGALDESLTLDDVEVAQRDRAARRMS